MRGTTCSCFRCRSGIEGLTRQSGTKPQWTRKAGWYVMDQKLPTFEDLLWPTLKVLERRGGSATIQELSEDVAGELDLPDELANVQHGSGPGSEVDYRAAWARTHLKRIGVVENTSRVSGPLRKPVGVYWERKCAIGSTGPCKEIADQAATGRQGSSRRR